MKIPKPIRTEHIEMQIVALQKLDGIYRQRAADEPCPLCKAAGNVTGRSAVGLKVCNYCPWMWITGQGCCKWNHARGYYAQHDEKIMFSPRQVKLRIQQIKRWIEALQREVERRKIAERIQT